MKSAVLMCRVSTDEQANSGYSIQLQERELKEYCVKNDITILKVFKEDYSAKNFERPEFNRFLDYAKSNKQSIDLLLVTTWDRFSRNVSDSYMMISKLKKMGIETQAIQQPIDLTIPENKLILSFYLTMPDVDNHRRSVKVKSGIVEARKSGRWTTGAPYGYTNKRDEFNKPIIVPDENSKWVKYIFEQFASGNKTQEYIRNEISMDGIRIAKNSMSRLLRNKLYIGQIEVPEFNGVPSYFVQGIHQPIVSKDIFYKVQDVLASNNKAVNKAKHHTAHEQLPLRGIICCQVCGNNVTGSASRSKTGKRHFYYHCNYCKKNRFRAEKANKIMEDILSDLTIKSEVEELYVEIMKKLISSKEGFKAKDKEILKKNLDNISDKKNKLDELLLEGNLEVNDYNRLKEKVKVEEIEIKRRLSSINNFSEEFSEFLKKGIVTLKNLGNAYKNYDVKAKQLLLSSTFPKKVEFHDKKCRTPEINSAILLISSIDKGVVKIKKGQITKNLYLSREVLGAGIEPARSQ